MAAWGATTHTSVEDRRHLGTPIAAGWLQKQGARGPVHRFRTRWCVLYANEARAPPSARTGGDGGC